MSSDNEMISRVRLMAGGKCDTWDLSPNDIKALRHVLDRLTAAETQLAVAIEALREIAGAGEPSHSMWMAEVARNALAKIEGDGK